ncbi:MAG: hypothetical protein R3C52_05045 [Hyphomonadaceae bacterium]
MAEGSQGGVDVEALVARIEQRFAETSELLRADTEHIARSSEATLERLAGTLAEALAREIANRMFAGGSDTGASANQFAAAIARAAIRGGRFR